MANMLFLLFYMMCLCVFAFIKIIEYILYGVGLHSMAREAGLNNGWMAFVPFVRKYLQGKLGGPITLRGKTIKEPGLWMVLLPFAVGIAAGLLTGLAMALIVLGSLIQANVMVMIPVAGVVVLACVVIFLLVLIGTAAKNGLRALVNYQILSRYCQGNVLILHIVFSTFLPLYEAIVFFYYRHHTTGEGEEEV